MKQAFKRIMALALVIAVMLGVLPSVLAANIGDFTDVKDDAWYAKYVEYVVFQDLMNGTSATTFEPNSALTRAMTATVLWRVAGEPPVYNKSTFTDLKGDWYMNAVAWAQAEKVVNGVTATTFAPDSFVTREQIVAMMWRFKGSPAVEGDYLKDFKDAAKVSAYARDAFNWAISVGIINGDNGSLKPQANATRAEFAKIIYQYAQLTKPCAHAWDEGKVTKEATCTEAGEKTFTCTKCGVTKTEPIPAKGHTYGEDGKCTVCGEQKPDEPTPPTPAEEYVVIYYPKESKVMTTEEYTYTGSNGSKVELAAANATLADGKVTTSATNAAEFQMIPADGTVTFKTKDGKYLYADGTDVKLVGTEGENTKFVLEDAEGGKYIRCATAKVNNNAQYLEYFMNYFTVFRMDDTKKDIYVFGLYPLATGGDTPTPPTPTGDYVLTNELKDGDEVVIYNPGYGKAIKNETDNDWYLIAQDVTPENNKITTDDATIVWTAKKNSDGTFSFVNGTNAITGWYSKNDKGEFLELTNNASYSGGSTVWNVVSANAADNTFYISNATLLGEAGAGGYIECYTKKTGIKICGFYTATPTAKDYGFQFFVKGGTTPTPDPKPDPEPTPDPKPTNAYVLTNELKDGDEVVIYNPGYGKAIKNETDNDWYLIAQDVTPENNKITTDDATIVWTAKKNSDGTFSFVNGTNAITGWYSKNDKGEFLELTNNASYSGGSTVWNVVSANAADNTFYISNATLLGEAGAGGYIECYTKKTGIKICGFYTATPTAKDYGFQFFVKGGTTPTPPTPPTPGEHTEHTYGNATYAWTEAEGGYTCVGTKACTYEGCTEKLTATATVTYKDDPAATCTADGKRVYTATFAEEGFGTDTKEVTLPKLDHNWGDGVVTTEPKCEEKGVKTFTCTVCKTTKTEDIPATGHNWGDGVVTTEPKCEEKGVKTFTCTVCKTTKTEDIPATGHNWGDDGKCTNPGCTETKPADVVYTKATAWKDGDKVVIVNTKQSKALSKEIIANFYKAGVAVTAVDGKILNPDSAIVWTIAADGEGFNLSNDEGKKLSIDGTFNSIPYDKSNDAWTATAATTEGCVYIKNENGKYLSWRTDKGNFTVSTDNKNADECIMEIYVKKVPAQEHTEHTYGNATYAWTEAESGYTCVGTRACTYEGCTEKLTATATVTYKDDPAATCTADGKRVYTATFAEEGFGTDTKEVTLPKLGHNWGDDGKCTVCGAQKPAASTGKYVPATTFADGDKIVIVATHGGKLYAMSTAVASSVAPAVEVTAGSDGALTEVGDTIVWTLVKAKDENAFYLQTGTQQLKVSKGDLSLSKEGGLFNVTPSGVSCTSTATRALFTQSYNNSIRFKNYATSNLGNANYATSVTVYKYVTE